MATPVPKRTRTKRFTMNLSINEARMLHAMADDAGTTLSGVVRRLIREHYQARAHYLKWPRRARKPTA